MAKSNKVAKNNKVKGTSFFKNEKFHVALGVILMLISIYLFLALFSFLIYGAEDMSILQSEADFSEANKKIHNWTAYYGAQIACFLINKCLGVSALLLIIPLSAVSLYLMKVTTKIWKLILFPIIGLLILPIMLHFFFSSFLENSFLNIGGYYGELVTGFLFDRIGNVGIFLLLLAIIVLFCIFAFKSTIGSIQKIFS